MKKWLLGFALVGLALLSLPFAQILFLQNGGYGMRSYGYGWHMPMMFGGNGMMGFGLNFMWLLLLASLILIGLGIAWLVKALTVPKETQLGK